MQNPMKKQIEIYMGKLMGAPMHTASHVEGAPMHMSSSCKRAPGQVSRWMYEEWIGGAQYIK